MLQRELKETSTPPSKSLPLSGEQDTVQEKDKRSEAIILCESRYAIKLHKLLRVPGAGCFCQRRGTGRGIY